ncbi:hypothetical protein [Pacificoceanicola onchidii]|uniref:hypothetical protein n=1 Tax=Pacificoceanicola onchidii TaxID=2562685 RepID=UPI0010A511C6|nr:hypothetical protein [Pacificoceanicola onchidii]
MKRKVIIGLAVAVVVAGCAPRVPDSGAGVVDSGRGVGFSDYSEYEAERDSALSDGTRPTTVPGPVDVRAQPLNNDAAVTGEIGPAPQSVSNAVGISDENDFDAVSAERDIDADAALIAQNRAQFQVIEPTELPTRPGTNRPNIVEYALRTTNPKGAALYKRSKFRAEAKYNRACGDYTSADLAQEDFLALGGPEKDRKGMDPDGDGFACTWDPAPFRAARNG